MSKKTIYLLMSFVIILTLFISNNAYAETMILTLDHAVWLAKKNTHIINKIEGVRVQKIKIENGSYYNSIDENSDLEIKNQQSIRNNPFGWDKVITRPLFTGFAMSTRTKMLQIGTDLMELEKESAVLDIIEKVKSAYYNVLLTQKMLKTLEDNIVLLEEHVLDARDFYSQQLILKSDLEKSEMALNLSKEKKEKTGYQVLKANEFLKILTNLDIDTGLELEEIEDVTFGMEEDVIELIRIAKAERLELKMIKSTIENSEFKKDIINNSFHPNFDLTLGSSDNHKEDVDIDWSSFDLDNQVEEKNKLKKALKNQFLGVSNNIALEVKEASLDQKFSREDMIVAKDILLQARKNWKNSRESYKDLLISSVDVLHSNYELVQSEHNFYAATYRSLMAQEKLVRTIGGQF